MVFVEKLLQRGYLQDLIETEVAKVHFATRPNEKFKKVSGVPFLVTYHPLLKKLNGIIDKMMDLFYMNQNVKKVFSPRPLISFHCSRKLSSYIVRANVCQSKGL